MSSYRIAMTGARQMTLGDLIAALECLPLISKDGRGSPRPKRVFFDFGLTYPGHLTSYRGFYNELGITFEPGGRADPKRLTAEAFLMALREALTPGLTFGGWKGGEYQMRADTPVWVAQWGDAGATAVVGVRDTGAAIVIDTAWCEP